jgi:hypothetical protein
MGRLPSGLVIGQGLGDADGQRVLVGGCVSNELIIVKDAPHFGVMFDTEDIRSKLFAFLERVGY